MPIYGNRIPVFLPAAGAMPQAKKAPLAKEKKRKGAAWGAAAWGEGAKLIAKPLMRAC